MSKTIITVAPTGAWPKKENNPNIPMTPVEIVEDVYACWNAGAAVAHLHMRDDNGNGTMDVNKFRETVTLLKTKYPDCDIVINMTTSGDIYATDEIRVLHVKELKPDMASYDCGSMNWQNNTVFINSPQFLEMSAKVFREVGTKPEIEIFDAGMVYNSLYYLKKDILKAPLHYQFVLGAAGGSVATVENLVYLRNLIPEGSTWSALGIGKGHIPIMMAAIALGGNVRVGMEDNLMYGHGQLAESNVQLVKRAVGFVRLAGNIVATPDDAREILGL